MNVSDFAAKGVRPSAALVSIGLPKELTEEKTIREIGKGLNDGAREYDTYIIGGDTGEALELVISLSLFGVAGRKRLMLRSGAKPGDILAVTGFFGKTSGGLKILLNHLDATGEIPRILVESVLTPHARLREGLALSRTGAVTAAIDSSDGLAWSLHEIARSSGVGALINKLPIAREAEIFAKDNKLDSLELALYGGEEYELVLAVKPKLWSRAREAVEKAGGQLLQIGKVTDEKRVLLEMDGKSRRVEARGYEHFKT